MHTDTRKITEGAMMVAIVGLLLFINRQLAGMLEYAMYWFLAFPILIYTVRYGIKAAMLPALSMLLLSVLLGMPTTIFYLASALISGMGYGYGVIHRWQNRRLLLFTGVITIVSYFITMVLFASLFGYDIQEDILFAEKMAQQLHIGNIDVVQLALTASIILSVTTAVLQTICIHLFAVILLRRLKIQQFPMKTVFDCALPKWVGYISICIWLLFSLRNVLKLEGNLSVVIISAYFIDLILLCGECILDIISITIVMRKRIIGIILSLACIAALVFTPTRILITLIGIVSILKDARREWKRSVINGTIGKS